MPNGDKEKQFWEWVRRTYGFEQEDILKNNYPNLRDSPQWDYFLTYYYKWPAGSELEHYGISQTRWAELEALRNPADIQDKLNYWLKGKAISSQQAASIWEELSSRRTGEYERFLYGTVSDMRYGETQADYKARMRKEELARLKETGAKGIGGIPEWQLEEFEDKIKSGELTKEQVSNFVQGRVELQERATARAKLGRAWAYNPPQPEYGRAFTELEAGLAGAEPWQDWFGQQYPSIVAKFQTTIPKLERKYWKGMYPGAVEARVEKTWAEYLKAEVPKQKEEYATRYPFGQYGRPWAYQPRIQTVQF